MFVGVIIGVLVSMGMVLLRAVFGPSVFDRVLAANSFGTHVVVLIALMGHLMDTIFFIDVALTYALINFIATVAFLRYFKFRSSK